MKRATLTDTKNNLSALVDQVQHGETILILDRGRPVARLEPAGEETIPRGGLPGWSAKGSSPSLGSAASRGSDGETAPALRRRECPRSPPRRAQGRPVKFWDSSALVPLLVEEEATVPLRDLCLE